MIDILEELIEVISEMRKENGKYLLQQNENEAKEWLEYLRCHNDKEELDSLEAEISKRFVWKFDVRIEYNRLDDRRLFLMSEYLNKSNDFLK